MFHRFRHGINPCKVMSHPMLGSLYPVATEDTEPIKPKRKRSFTRKNEPVYRQKYSCGNCLDDWGMIIENGFDGNPDTNGVTNPKYQIPTFSSLEDRHTAFEHAHPSIMSDRKLFDRYLKHKATS